MGGSTGTGSRKQSAIHASAVFLSCQYRRITAPLIDLSTAINAAHVRLFTSNEDVRLEPIDLDALIQEKVDESVARALRPGAN